MTVYESGAQELLYDRSSRSNINFYNNNNNTKFI